jgi:hypothetical protein
MSVSVAMWKRISLTCALLLLPWLLLAQQARQVTLAWCKSTPGQGQTMETCYQVLRCTATGGPSGKVPCVPTVPLPGAVTTAPVVTYTDTTVVSGLEYYYAVIGTECRSNTSALSNIVAYPKPHKTDEVRRGRGR